MKPYSSAPKILVVLSNASITHRKHLEGILRYVKTSTRPVWEVILDLRDINRASTLEYGRCGIDGIIAAVHAAGDRREYLNTGLPTVLFEPKLSRPEKRRRPANVITFFNDHEAEGRTAAEYFLQRGYETFAYVGTPEMTEWSDARLRGYTSRLRLAGHTVTAYPRPPKAERTDFALESSRLIRWLGRLPTRTALFCAHDERAQQVVSAAMHASIGVPEHIAVLGVDDDELLCETASPTISSIPVEAEATGYRFAQALDALLTHGDHEPIIRTCHTRVISRRSTDAFALTDPFLSRALSYAAANLASRPRLADLAREARCSIRTLQQRSLDVLGHPMKEELTELQLDEALRRLDSGETEAEAAAACGFCSAAHLRHRLASR